MSEESYKFTEETMKFASFRLLLQNNAMLREVLRNQARIMTSLTNLETQPPTELDEQVRVQMESVFIQEAQVFESVALKETWEWVEENGPDMDNLIKGLFPAG